AWIIVPNLKFTQVSAINNEDVFGIGTDKLVYHWDGKTLSKLDKEDTTAFGYIFAPSGTKKTITLGRTEQRNVNGASVVDKNSKHQEATPDAAVAIEIEKIGMGGGISPESINEYVALPMKKKPRVAGFAETKIEKFILGSTLQLDKLLSKGAAWLETPLATPDCLTISFLARVGDAGGIEVILGQDISTNFIWKVCIGGWNNTKSGIIRRTIVDNVPTDTVVAQTLPEEDPNNTTIPSNPLACAQPGQLVPYWITFNKGLFLVGMGAPGDNIFLSCRDPNPPTNINRVGFGSDNQPAEYSNIQLYPPVVITKPERAYVVTQESILPTTTLDWTGAPFRVIDSGALSFEIQGEEQVVVGLGNDEHPSTEDYYQVVFGYGNNEGILIQKWIAEEKSLKNIASVSSETYPGIKLDPAKPTRFWISYEYSQIMVGQGDIGQNLILCTKDIAPLEHIRSIAYGTLSKKTARITNVSVYPSVKLEMDASLLKNQPPVQQTKFAGNVTIIFPFEYEFSQLEQSIRMEDLVNHQSFYVAATPRQGTRYTFILTLSKDGTPKLDLYGSPNDEILKDVQDSLKKAQAEINAKRAAATALAKSGDKEKKSYDKQADELKKTAGYETSAATIAKTAGFVLTQKGIAAGELLTTGLGVAATAASFGLAVMAQDTLIRAGEKQLRGKEAQLAAQKNSLIELAKVERMDIEQKLLAGQAQFSFRNSDSYVYIDKANRQALGSTEISQEAAENTANVTFLLSTLKTPTKTSIANYIGTVQKIILFITDLAVVADANTRQQIYKAINVMLNSYKQLFPTSKPAAMQTQIMNILLNAYNNTFLINATDDYEAKTKTAWLASINQLATPSILQKNTDINLEPMFGEYIWYPQPIVNNKVTLTFQAKTNNDIFICFSPINQAVRNTDTELYEVVIGGWDDTKSVIRIKSLDHSAKEVEIENMVNSLDYQDYWLTHDKGSIDVGTGTDPNKKETVVLSWKDLYANGAKPMKYIGFSCWNSPLTLRNIAIVDASANVDGKAKK
ncbi:MAG: hypothetical protein WCT20_01900, partial [Candidatus Babeliales bacterium]